MIRFPRVEVAMLDAAIGTRLDEVTDRSLSANPFVQHIQS